MLTKVRDNQLLNILVLIKNNNCSDRELNSLAHYCINLSVHYLNARHSSFFQSSSNTLEKRIDVAVDAITPLFTEAGNESRLGIEKSLLQWNKNIETEADADFFINRLVWNRTEQTIIAKYKQNDPFFAKIYKTISTCISENNFKKMSFLGIYYIVRDTITKIDGRLISQDSFDNLPDSLFFKKQSALINGLLVYIKKELSCCPAIPINQLIKRIKHLCFRDFNNSSVDDRDKLELNLSLKPALNKSLEEVNIKLDHYYEKNKLTKHEYSSFQNAFKNISIDLMNGGNLESLYQYLSDEIPGLTQETFYSKYHRTFNYIFNIFRSSLAEELERKL